MSNVTLPAHAVFAGFLGFLGLGLVGVAMASGLTWPAWFGILAIIGAGTIYVRCALARDMEQILAREIGALDLRVRMASNNLASVPRSRRGVTRVDG